MKVPPGTGEEVCDANQIGGGHPDRGAQLEFQQEEARHLGGLFAVLADVESDQGQRRFSCGYIVFAHGLRVTSWEMEFPFVR